MSRRLPTPLRAAAAVVIWAVGAFVLALLLAAALPLALGDHSYVVVSGSMAPAVETGDMVVVETISPDQASVGDIVTFKDPNNPSTLITHRAVSIDRQPQQTAFVTQGDANTGREHWNVAANGEIGRVLYRVPKLGFAVAAIGSPGGRIGLVMVPALLLGISLLIRIWARDERDRERGGSYEGAI